MKRFSLIFALLAIGIGCKSHKTSPDVEEIELGLKLEERDSKPVKKEEEEESQCTKILDSSDFSMDNEDQYAGLIKLELRDNCLEVKYQFSGCQMGQAFLIKQPVVQNKMGFTQNLKMVIRGAGPCEMLVETTAYFDLQGLGQGPEVVNLRVNDQLQIAYREN